MLAEEHDANVDLVLIGILLMDIKLSEAIKMNKRPEHTKMSSDFAKEFLKDYDLTDEERKIIRFLFYTTKKLLQRNIYVAVFN